MFQHPRQYLFDNFVYMNLQIWCYMFVKFFVKKMVRFFENYLLQIFVEFLAIFSKYHVKWFFKNVSMICCRFGNDLYRADILFWLLIFVWSFTQTYARVNVGIWIFQIVCLFCFGVSIVLRCGPVKFCVFLLY